MRKLQLHYWYVDEKSYDDKVYKIAHGIVSGHGRLDDTTFINTSEVRNIIIDKEQSEAIIQTKNSEYHCPLEYCRWSKQDEISHIVPDYEWIKENYKDKIEYPTIEDDKVLLVLSNFDEYYFNSLYYKPSEEKKSLLFIGYPHIGMFQDSYLIRCKGAPIDIRYFPHYNNIDLYSEETDNKPFFIENIGDTEIYVQTSKGNIRLNPGERKEVLAENTEKEIPSLRKGDLYPVGLIDE